MAPGYDPGYALSLTMGTDWLKDFKPGIFTSSDGGKTWRSITGEMWSRTMVLNSLRLFTNRPDTLFLITRSGVFMGDCKGQ